MKIVASLFVLMLVGAGVAYAQNCRPGQGVVCDYNSATRITTCYCR